MQQQGLRFQKIPQLNLFLSIPEKDSQHGIVSANSARSQITLFQSHLVGFSITEVVTSATPMIRETGLPGTDRMEMDPCTY